MRAFNVQANNATVAVGTDRRIRCSSNHIMGVCYHGRRHRNGAELAVR